MSSKYTCKQCFYVFKEKKNIIGLYAIYPRFSDGLCPGCWRFKIEREERKKHEAREYKIKFLQWQSEVLGVLKGYVDSTVIARAERHVERMYQCPENMKDLK